MSLNPKAQGSASSDMYFAQLPRYSEEMGNELQAKVDDYYNWLTSSALVQLWRRSYYAYYGLLTDGAGTGFGMFAIGTIIPTGMEGELCKLKVNHYANLVDHQHVLVTQSRPALESRAVNSDSASLEAAYLSDGLLEYFFRERKLETNYRDTVHLACKYGEGFVRLDWDSSIGSQYGVDDHGAPVYDGDVVAKTYNPFDMIRDTTLTSPKANTWYICRDTVNKWDLVAKYPHLREEILDCHSDNSTISTRKFLDPTKVIPQMGSSVTSRDSVLIDQYEFLHAPSPACPDGRYTVFIEGGTILFDGPLPFENVPVYRCSAGEIEGTPFGWTHNFDLLGIQEAVDKLKSVALTNQMANGVQNLWQPTGNGLAKTQIDGGLNLLESDVKPEVLELCKTPPEVFSNTASLVTDMETLSGVSAVSRGQTPENLKSGSALAFVNATSLSFSSGLQNSANGLVEDMGNGLVEFIQRFASTPRIATIAGSANMPLMKSYSSKDLIPIDRVTVEDTAAVSKTTAGKIQIAQDLLQSGLIKTAKEYLTVITTGKLEPLYEGEMAEILLVRSENEFMRDGKAPTAIRIDEHAFHISEHKSLLSNPSARMNAQLVKTVLDHIAQHEELQQMLQATDPAFLAATQQQPLPFPAPPQPAGPQAVPPPQPVKPGPPGIARAQMAPNNAGASTDTRKPGMPSLPAGSPPQAQQANAQFASGAAR
jgi:hypothetical protein